MYENLKEKTREALTAVLPITCIVLALTIVMVPVSIGAVSLFLACAALLVVGMGLFQLGAEMAMTPLGEGVGVTLSKTKKLWIALALTLVVGIVITVSEPDLQVLAGQVPSIPNGTLIITVSVGVGLLLALAILRILLRIKLSTILCIVYAVTFGVAFFAPSEFLPLSFDSGGVTTGPVTVPFIMALGVGMAALRTDKGAEDDSFGLVALCSVGPMIPVLLLSILYKPESAAYAPAAIADIVTTRDVVREIGHALPHYAKEVLISFIPIVAMFLVFQLATRRFHRIRLLRMTVGLVYTYFGLVLFLCGANVGFAPVGSLLGGELAGHSARWLIIPVGMLMGYFTVMAEPAVQVLIRQVDEVTNGAMPAKTMNRALSIGVAVSVGLSMLRVLTGIHIFWIIIPGYLLALIMSRLVPPIFVGIAFDSGGVSAGPMTATFLLPLSMGVCAAVGGNVMTDAFGVIALVAMTPLIAIQAMGLVYRLRARKLEAQGEFLDDDEILDLEENADD